MTKSNDQEITIINAGPIQRFSFTVPKNGGVVELLGWNGVGKTHALGAIQATIDHRSGIVARDGTAAAQTEVLGVTARFGRRSTFSGELEVEVLEGKFSVADLIDPEIKDPKAADARRIKALIQLATGEESAKPELFHELLAGGKVEFEREVSLRAMSEADVVLMAAAIKRDLETAARRDAELAEKARLRYETFKASVADLDLGAPDDEQELALTHEKALRDFGGLEAEAKAAREANQRAQEAQEKLNRMSNLEPVEFFENNLKISRDALNEFKAEALALEKQMQKLAAKIESQAEVVALCKDALAIARERQNLIDGWQADIKAGEVEPISDAELQESARFVAEARAAMELGRDVRRAKERLANAEENKRIATELKIKAEALRNAAQGTDTVLSKIVQQLNCPLRVSRGRLVTDSERGEELFSDLSDGERVKLAMQIAIEAVRRPDQNGLLVIEQRFWQDLNPANQQLINEMLQGTGVVVITARATNDLDLRAQILDADPEPALLP